MAKKTPAPRWVYIIAKDMEIAIGLPNTPTLVSIWKQTSPSETANIPQSGKGNINNRAIAEIDWTDEVVQIFLKVYFNDIGKRKLTMDNWAEVRDKESFETMCQRLRDDYGFLISQESGFKLPSGHFEEMATKLSENKEIANRINSIVDTISSGDGNLTAKQLFALIETIMKVRHPSEPYFRGNARLPDKVRKSVGMLSLVDTENIHPQSVADIPCAYCQFMDRIGFLRSKHGVHGTESFDEDVYTPALLKSLAMFAVGFYYLHFPD